MTNYGKLTFWQKLVEIHKVMFRANKDLKKPHMFESKPQDWPLIKRGLGL
jgi:dolichyl-phosphate-mannose-protein mannosyltransferase